MVDYKHVGQVEKEPSILVQALLMVLFMSVFYFGAVFLFSLEKI